MTYKRLFDPNACLAGRAAERPTPYAYTDEIILAVNVALVTARPLLVSGRPGCGKSSLARDVAWLHRRRFYEIIVSSRTEARDCLYHVDVVRRLSDAQSGRWSDAELRLELYIEPRALWWAFDPGSAARRGLSDREFAQARTVAATDPGEGGEGAAPPVVLIDEIDKADPDVPNDLLVAIEQRRFRVEETGAQVAADKDQEPPLLFITTNRERDLPAAFMRRCVVLHLEPPGRERLLQIARLHFPNLRDEPLLGAIADRFHAIEEEPGLRLLPSAAEFIDTVRACTALGLRPDDSDFEALTSATLRKERDGARQ